MSKDDIDKFEEQEMKKIKWFDWSIKQNVMEKKPKITRDKLKDKIINHIWTLSKTKKEKEERKKKKHNDRTNKDRIIREIRRLFEQEEKEEDYYETKRVNNLWNNSYIEYEGNSDKNRNLSR